jgi:hypothetical protein
MRYRPTLYLLYIGRRIFRRFISKDSAARARRRATTRKAGIFVGKAVGMTAFRGDGDTAMSEWSERERREDREGEGRDEDEEVPVESLDDLPPEARVAIEALLSEPFPQRPFALVPEGGERTREHADYLIHKDIDTERQCVFIFDSIVDAFAVAEEYKQATGNDAEPVEIDIDELEEDRFWVRFYRANGARADIPLPFYKQWILPPEERYSE